MKQSAFISALKFASHAMALKDVRYYLNGVLFEFRGNALTLVGTDGHRLAYAELEHDAQGTVEMPLIIDGASVKLLLSAFKANSTAHIFFEHGTDVLIVRGAGDMAIPCKPIEGKYPDWRRVSLHKAERPIVPTGRIGVNAGYLADAAKACGALCASRHNGITIDFYGPTESMIGKPDQLPAGVTDARVVVMPMRL